jgi:hypothetical protein
MRDRRLRAKPAVTSGAVIRAVATDADTLRGLRARSRSLTAAGVLPKGKGGRGGGGAAPWSLQHATFLILSAAVAEAISASNDVAKIARLKGDDGENLAEVLKGAMDLRRRIIIGDEKDSAGVQLHHVMIYAGHRGEYFASIEWRPKATDDEGYVEGFNLEAEPNGHLGVPPLPVCRATMIHGDVFRRVAHLYAQRSAAATKASTTKPRRRAPKAAR